MAAGLPAGRKMEIEFTPGTWTDVTPWWDLSSPVTVKIGRTSEFSAPSVGAMDGVRLTNTDGRFTPACQVLVDGSPNPFWPNVQPNRRIRYSNTPMGVRFVGKIKGWPPRVGANGSLGVMLTATDWLDAGSRVDLRAPIAQEVREAGPVLSWALTEPVDSGVAVEGSGGPVLVPSGAGPALAFGAAGPGVGDGTGVVFAPAAIDSGQYLAGAVNLTLDGFAVECWVNAGTVLPSWAGVNSPQTIIGLGAGEGGGMVLSLKNGVPEITAMNSLGVEVGVGASSASVADGGWHHIAATRDTFPGPIKLYVDGVWKNNVPISSAMASVAVLTVGETPPGWYYRSRFQGNVGHVGIYNHALSDAQIALHSLAGRGFVGETTSARIARWLGYAGLTAADWTLDTGQAIVGTYPQAGKDIVAACQDMATTEGGGSAFYAAPDGKPTFTSRANRKPGNPTLTLSATGDLDTDSYSPSFDALTLVNSVKASRAGSSGTLSEQTWTDAASGREFGPSDDPLTSYATTDADVLQRAQSRVAGNARPGFRLGQVGVDLVTAANNLYATAAAVRIGSRIRVNALPAALCPATQVDVIAEGWTETTGLTSYLMVFDTSPADNPPRGVWDDTTYGRWQASGQTLAAAITKTATALWVATGAGLPLFTTVSARYPVSIVIGAEVITLNTAPTGSPQMFTGVTRGAAGTSPAAQANGAAVSLSPAATFTL